MDGLHTNLTWYGRLRLAQRALVWLPVAFLYFQSRVGLDGALRLSGLYYLAVVVAEVPSGWFSDRVGRVTTLRLSAAFLLIAHLLFVSGDSFGVFAAGQIAVALSFAFHSGTDVALHYDTTEALDRTHEFEGREARIATSAYLVTMVAAVVGGALGAVDLRLPFAAGAAIAGVQLAITFALREPPRTRSANPFGRQIGDCLRYLRAPLLGWLFLYVVAQLTLEHLSVELGQPYLAELLGENADELQATPLFVGLLLAVVALIGSLSAAQAIRLREGLGLIGALVLLAGVEAVIAVGMWVAVSWAVVPLMALRSTQPAVADVLVPAAVSPLIRTEHRATYLSMGSLAGRLGYGSVLVALGTTDDFTRVRTGIGITSVAILALVAATAPLATGRAPATE